MKRRMLEVLILIAVALVPATALCQNAGANDEKVGKLPPCKDKERLFPPSPPE